MIYKVAIFVHGSDTPVHTESEITLDRAKDYRNRVLQEGLEFTGPVYLDSLKGHREAVFYYPRHSIDLVTIYKV